MPLSVHDFGGATISLLTRWPDSAWNAMNPTLVEHAGRLLCFVRLIEGDIDDNERYTLYRDYESRIGMVELNPYTFAVVPGSHRLIEVVGTDALKVEDVRAFVRDGRLFLAGGLLEHNEERTWFSNVMVELEVDLETGTAALVRELPPRWEGSREKNWTVPVVPASFEYLVDAGRVFSNGVIAAHSGIEDRYVEALHGGTQAVPITVGEDRCWLTVMHRQIMLEDDFQSWRYHVADSSGRQFAYYSMLYLHHVVIFDAAGRLVNVGRPFIFDKPMVEFAAGIIDRGDQLLVSYGSLDRESRLAILPKFRLLEHGFPYTGLDWRT